MSQKSTEPIIGGLPPPLGVIPNFEDPYSIAPVLHGITILLLVLSTFSTIIRMYTRFQIMKDHGWEDYIMFVAWLGFLAYCAVGYPALRYGAGVHQWNVPATSVIEWAKWGAIAEVVYPPLIALTKLSICIQFLHIFVPERGIKYWGVQVFIWINMLYFVACFFVSLFQCLPREKIWNPTVRGTCLNYKPYILATGIFNCVSDALMLIFPVFSVWDLHMSFARKLGVSAIFLVGTLAVISSIMRIVYSSINNQSHDSTYHLTQVGMCTVGEICAGIVIGNLILFPRFFKTCTPKLSQLFSSYRASTKTGSNRPSDLTISKSWQKIPGKAMPGQRSEEVLTAESIELSHSISGISLSSREP
ncbi:uncharacterized protein EAF02_004637 [Botrytis sinoallii]|uniref:uncharacterized protein n=1 Tax=Botrytis sinoallii TaxID=1463999 RepID=UPI0019029321|nr:uncharacterized protein EAF02_004637 [Botrytis sinoallii]KAF7884301.1 hypothetical protein EAF02_004637 [Botrytis sinoallii]